LFICRQFLQAAETADTVIAIDRIAVIGGLQVPARAEELLAGAGQDRDPQIRVVAKISETPLP
jgi:hypothetical protein